jgi:phosphotransferase family enzyme
MSDDNLSSYEKREIIRIGNAIHRPTHWWTPAVHELLRYLESSGFPYSPRVLGFDDVGREVLTFIDGASGADGWAKITSDEGLIKFARLLRAYHEAVRDFKPSPRSEWAYSSGAPTSGAIMCHGDFGPWNIVWRDDEPVGIVDWDMALPAEPRFDILYALEYSAPFRDDATALEWHHFSTVPDRKHRIEVFVRAYGLDDMGDVVRDVAALQRQVGTFVAQLAHRGLQPQADWVANGELGEIEQRAQWTESHPELFTGD